MELIGGLAFLGNYVNNRDNKSKLEDNKQKLKVESHDDNIYSRDIFTKANKKYENLEKNRFEKSKNPQKTGVYPKYYKISKEIKRKPQTDYNLFTENDSQFSDEDETIQGSSVCSSAEPNNPLYFIDRSLNLIDNRKHERK